MHIFIDSDACPVKDEIVRVAERHEAPMSFVSNSWMRGPDHVLAERIVVDKGPDAADDWIAERAGPGDVVVTTDIPLARRCVVKGATVIQPTGRILDENSIGMAVAVRDLTTHLRDTGTMTGGPASFTKSDRSRFLERLEAAIQSIKRKR